MQSVFFCDTDVIIDLLHGKTPAFQQPVAFKESKICVSVFTLFEVTCHGKKSVSQTLSPWLIQNPSFMVASISTGNFQNIISAYFGSTHPSQQEETHFMNSLHNEVFGFFASQFESTLLSLFLICTQSESLSCLNLPKKEVHRNFILKKAAAESN
jgi:hypothetical protein